MILCAAAYAGPFMTVAAESFDASAGGWNHYAPYDFGTFSYVGPGVGHAGYIQTAATTVGDPGIHQDSAIANSGASGGLLAGNQNYLGSAVSFDFYGAQALASGLQLYFASAGSGRTWTHGVESLGAGWNDGQTVAMAWSSGWTGGTEGQFNTDIADVDEIGFIVTYLDETAGQVWGWDNFRKGTSVPEPGTYAMLGVALASLGITFRRKLSESVGQLTKAMKS